MKIRICLNKTYGRIEIEGDSFDEIIERMREFPEWQDVIDNIIITQATGMDEKSSLKGIIENTVDGPVIIISRDSVRDREAVGLLLYATDPQGLRPKDLGKFLSLSGFLSVGFASRISELKREGIAYKNGDMYRLTTAGKKWIEELISSLKPGGM